MVVLYFERARKGRRDFPDSSVGKESACNMVDTGDTGLILELKILEKETAHSSILA